MEYFPWVGQFRLAAAMGPAGNRLNGFAIRLQGFVDLDEAGGNFSKGLHKRILLLH